jgi:hypothetical protein
MKNKQSMNSDEDLKNFSNKNLYNAFHSRLFVDDCDLNVKLNTLNSIQEMFRIENKKLEVLLAKDD